MPYNMDAAAGSDSQLTTSKPKRAVSIILDVSSDDNVRIRQFTLKASSQAIRVGRSSRNDENYMPGIHNAWFESRVISRNHAAIRAIPEEQKLCLYDESSMHGSYVNGKKIENRAMHPLQSGDKIMFGSDIVRGPETFAPVVAKIEFEWHEDLSTKHSYFSNRSFIVPCESDYDDDDVEFLQEHMLNPEALRTSEKDRGKQSLRFSVPESDASSAGSFDHDEPPSKDNEVPLSAFKLHQDTQNLETSKVGAETASAKLPKMTDHSSLCDTEKLNSDVTESSLPAPMRTPTKQAMSDEALADAVDELEMTKPLGAKSDDMACNPLKELARASVDIGLTESDSDEALSLRSDSESPCSPVEPTPVSFEITNGDFHAKQTCSNRGRKLELSGKANTAHSVMEDIDDDASDVESIHTDQSESSGSDISDALSNDENIAASPACPRTFQPIENQENVFPTLSPLRKAPLSGLETFDHGRDPSPSDAAMAKPAIPPPIPPAHFRPSVWNSPYCQMPINPDFKPYRPEWVSSYSAFDRPSPGDFYTFDSPPPIHPYTEGPFSSHADFKYDPLYTRPDSVFGETRTQHFGTSAAAIPDPAPKNTTKVSIDSIVEKPQNSASEQKTSSSLKRKRADMSNDDEEENEEMRPAPGSVDDTFPDARLQENIPVKIHSMPETSKVVLASQINNTEKVSPSEPPTKRVKLMIEERPAQRPVRRYSRARQFAKYTAAGVGGALVGAVGVLGALVALPEGFFN